MKKLILAMVFVFATGTMMNANTSNKEVTTPTTKEEVIEIVEEFGCASNCNSAAREGAMFFSEDHTDRGAGGELMNNYSMLYSSCYDANC